MVRDLCAQGAPAGKRCQADERRAPSVSPGFVHLKIDSPDQAIPKDALDSAECVAVFPGEWGKSGASSNHCLFNKAPLYTFVA